MNRFSATHADSADKAAAAALHARAAVLVAAGAMAPNYRDGCMTLADVRRKVKAAESLATIPDELPDSFTTPAVTDADEADRRSEAGYKRMGY